MTDLPILIARQVKSRPEPSAEEIYQKLKEDAVQKRSKDFGPWLKEQTKKKKKGWKPEGGAEEEEHEHEESDDDESSDSDSGHSLFPPGIPVDENGLLPKFDPSVIGSDATVVVFGKRRTGKSWIIRDLLYRKRNVFNHGLVISKTKFNGFWQNYFPSNVVHGNYDPAIIENFMKIQLKIMEQNEKNPQQKINPNAVIVLDDVIADKHVRYCDTLAALFYNGRHFNISLYLASQYVFGIPPGLRGNADFVFNLAMMQKRQRDQVAQDYGDIIENKQQFLNLLDANTRDRWALVINLSDPNIPVPQVYSRYRSDEVPMFEIGSLQWKRQVWSDGEKAMKDKYTTN